MRDFEQNQTGYRSGSGGAVLIAASKRVLSQPLVHQLKCVNVDKIL